VGGDGLGSEQRDSEKGGVKIGCFQAKTSPRPWLVDSAAEQHVSPDIDQFQELHSTSPQILTGATGVDIVITQAGTVFLETDCSGSPTIIVLREVLYCPQVSASLIFRKVLDNHGWTWRGGGGFDYLYDDTGSLGLVAKLNNSQYEVTALPVMRTTERAEVATYIAHALLVTPPLSSHADTAPGEEGIIPTSNLWHRRFGHLHYADLRKLSSGLVKGIPPIEARACPRDCRICIQAKGSRPPFRASITQTTQPLALLHIDLCGPMQTPTLGGGRYFMGTTDDYTGFAIVSILAGKSGPEIYAHLTTIISKLENLTGFKVQILRTDGGGEFCNNAMSAYLDEKGISHHTTTPYTPQSNGVAERQNRTLVSMTRAMLVDQILGDEYWGDAIETAAYIRNRSPTTDRDRTLYEMLFGIVPDVSHLRIFGSPCMYQVPAEKRTKLEDRYIPGIMLGYASENFQPGATLSKAYKVQAADGHIVVSRDVRFLERGRLSVSSIPLPSAVPEEEEESEAGLTEGLPWWDDEEEHVPHYVVQQTAGAWGVPSYGESSKVSSSSDSAATGNEDEQEELVPEQEELVPEQEELVPEQEELVPEQEELWAEQEELEDEEAFSTLLVNTPAQTPAPAPRRTTRTSEPPRRLGFKTAITPMIAILTSAKNAFAQPEAPLWRQAMDDEMTSQHEKGTWKLVELVPGKRPLTPKWVFTVKRDSAGAVQRFKARLVVRGFMQIPGVDFTEVYAPVSKHTTLRALLAMICAEDMEAHHLDIKTAFLNGDLDEEIYMSQPPGFEDGSPRVCKLIKAVYGLRQAPRQWHKKLKQLLNALGFESCDYADASLFTYWDESTKCLVFILVYVDDLLICSKTLEAVTWCKSLIGKEFEHTDLGPVSCFIGFEIERDRKLKTVKLNQRRLLMDLLSAFSRYVHGTKMVPMQADVNLEKDDEHPLNTKVYHYGSLVGSLLYLAVCSRPDISHVVSVLSRFMSCPAVKHWDAAVYVLQYLAGTVDLGIVYSESCTLEGYCDADFGRKPDFPRRSATGFVFLMNGGPVAWTSRRQPTVASSTQEAEYMAAASAVKEALWLRKLMIAFGRPVRCVEMYSDNQAAITLLQSSGDSARAKHIDIAHHFAKERVLMGDVIFKYLSTTEMVADGLTKPLSRVPFDNFKDMLGLKI